MVRILTYDDAILKTVVRSPGGGDPLPSVLAPKFRQRPEFSRQVSPGGGGLGPGGDFGW